MKIITVAQCSLRLLPWQELDIQVKVSTTWLGHLDSIVSIVSLLIWSFLFGKSKGFMTIGKIVDRKDLAMAEKTIWGIHAGRTGDADTLFFKNNCIAIGWAEWRDFLNTSQRGSIQEVSLKA